MAGAELLDQLNGHRVGAYRLRIRDFSPSQFANQRQFELYLIDRRGRSSSAPIMRGAFSAAVPSIFVPGWIDGEILEVTQLAGKSIQLWDEACRGGEALDLAMGLGAVIPPGGRLWLAYEQFGEEGKSIRETRVGLAAGVPILATPMGLLLYHADCWLGPRDWDIPEGGREGPRKVQGNKALDADHARTSAGQIRAELTSYLERAGRDDLHERARARAQVIVRDLARRF